MSKEQIAKELTLAIINKLLPTDQSNAVSFNKSLADEVAKAYNSIYASLNIVKEDETDEFVAQVI